MKKTKTLALTVLMAAGLLASCGGTTSTADTGPVNLKVWVAEAVVDTTKTMVDAWIAANPDFQATVTIEAQGEGDAASKVITDVESAADVFGFAQDQLARLKSAGAITNVPSTYATAVSTANDAGSVSEASIDNTMYAYPMTSDNGYFLYYDKAVVSEASVENMTSIIADCKAASKQFAFQLGKDGAWYNASFFFGAGCVSEWSTTTDGKFNAYNDTYNSPNGLVALKGMQELITSGTYVNSSSADAFSSGAAALVTGTWAYKDILKIFKDRPQDLGITDLPSYTVDGNSYHLKSFAGYKLMGVKPQTSTRRAQAAHSLANFLTAEAQQLTRFTSKGWGPSNKVAQENDAVKADVALAALRKQNECSVIQGQYPDGWWNLAASMGDSIQQGSSLESILANYAAGLDALKNA